MNNQNFSAKFKVYIKRR